MAGSADIRFDGKVVVVTGAGAGLGRQYALLFASRGASVVVNDLGGDIAGGGKSSRAADVVVDEIRKTGGTAVADYNSVEDGEAIIATALKAFQHVHVVVNNAGILRDKSFARTSDTDWDLIHRVHLRGSFAVTRAAWPHMKKQKYGRIIMTASAAGVYGNFGQANYSAAKLGLLGLSNTLAIEGAKDNIHCNCIAPTADSRLTRTVMPPNILEQLKPEYVAPLVLYLCHDSCGANHGLFECGAGWFAALRWQRSQGSILRTSTSSPSPVTPESVRDNWTGITDFEGASFPQTIQESVSTIMEKLQSVPASASTGSWTSADVARAKAHQFREETFSYDARDVMLYALGVGADARARPQDLRYVYEGSPDFAALPSFAIIPAQAGLNQLMAGVDGLDFNLMSLLHGEQYLELLRPLPTSATLRSKPYIVDVLDKGKGALIIMNVDSTDTADGQLVCRNQFSLFVRGKGGFGGPGSNTAVKESVGLPTDAAGKPDAVLRDQTSSNQAAVYRLCGDRNPLHIDPEMASMAGFDKPILHGLCTLGYAVRHVLTAFGGNDTATFRSIKCRFAAPVFPGETIETQMWRRGNRIHVECFVPERKVKVLSSGYVDLAGAGIPATVGLSSSGAGLHADALFAEMQKEINADLVKKTKAIFHWKITDDKGSVAGEWVVDLKNGDGSVARGGPAAGTKPGCTITVSDSTLQQLALAELDPMKAFMSGKLKVGGNIMLAQSLSSLFKSNKDKVAMRFKPAAATSLKAEHIFKDMANLVTPELVKQVKATYQWNITKDGKTVGQWTVDLQNNGGRVYAGTAESKAGCTITVADDDLEALVNGTLDPMKAFMSGKMKVGGNIMLAQKLQALFKSAKPATGAAATDTKATAAAVAAPSKGAAPSGLQAENIFAQIAKDITPEIAGKVKACFQWDVKKDGKVAGQWTVDLSSPPGSVYKGPAKGKPGCTLTLDDDTLVELTAGKIDPMKAFMSGKLKISGNMMLAQRLQVLFKQHGKAKL